MAARPITIREWRLALAALALAACSSADARDTVADRGGGLGDGPGLQRAALADWPVRRAAEER